MLAFEKKLRLDYLCTCKWYKSLRLSTLLMNECAGLIQFAVTKGDLLRIVQLIYKVAINYEC